jgi:hypothetical protein
MKKWSEKNQNEMYYWTVGRKEARARKRQTKKATNTNPELPSLLVTV